MRLERHVGKVVRIHRLDAVGSSEWHTEQEAKALPLAEIIDVGVLLAVFEDRVVVCGSRDGYGNVNSVGVIPRGWVKRVERLR